MTSTALVPLGQLDQPDDAVILFAPDPAQVYQEAREAAHTLMRRFEDWLKIGKAVVLARQQADAGKGGFLEILACEGLAEVLGSTKGTIKVNASRLESIMRDLPKVLEWRTTLTNDYERMHWASPGAVFKHCPFYRDQREPRVRGEPDPGMPSETVKALKKHNVQLQEQNATNEFLVERIYERGDVFENGDAADIAAYIVESIEDRNKLRQVCIMILKSLGVPVRDPDNPSKKKSGTYYRKQRQAREEAANT